MFKEWLQKIKNFFANPAKKLFDKLKSGEDINIADTQEAVKPENIRKNLGWKERSKWQQIQRGDFSQFEDCSKKVRNLAAMQAIMQFEDKITGNVPQSASLLEGQEMNPALRLGISIYSRSKDGFTRSDGQKVPSEFFRSLDDKMNTNIFNESLKPITPERKQAAVNEYRTKVKDLSKAQLLVDNDVQRVTASQDVMLRTTLLFQLGKTTVSNTKNGITETKEWDGNVANMAAHCSRTGVILPPSGTKVSGRQMIDKIYGDNYGKDAGMKSRPAATHDVERPTIDGSVRYKEKKGRTTGADKHYGIDVAIGGYGNPGVSGKTILANGNTGHIYSRIAPGDETHKGALLIGYESDRFWQVNQQGHRHMFGNGEAMSSFCSCRTDEIGDKYGGRTCDISALPPEVLGNILDRFTRKLPEMRNDPVEFRTMCGQLTGKVMSEKDMCTFLQTKLDYTPEQTKTMLNVSRHPEQKLSNEAQVVFNNMMTPEHKGEKITLNMVMEEEGIVTRKTVTHPSLSTERTKEHKTPEL